jgi:pyrroloquinoline quinone biosynthesis protein D
VTRERPLATAQSKPYLPRHVRLQFDGARERFAVLAPERVYWPDGTAVEVLKLCDGDRTISSIASRLAQDYAAPKETIQADVLEFIQSWTDLRLLRLSKG